jgi:protocatechuate 3,4-dioxygenase beta subunit
LRNMTEADLTQAVLARYSATPDLRLREILLSVIAHLHAIVSEVRLTEPEWMAAIEFLTATGQTSDDKRQEMILLSDNLGVSSLVNLIADDVPEGATETTVLGPFYVGGSPDRELGDSIAQRRTEGDETLVIHGHVIDLDGHRIPNAAIEVWQTDTNGMYDIQDPQQPEHNLRGRYHADEEGYFQIHTIRPTKYPIPTDGPVGELLRATNRHPWRPAHIHAIVTSPGYAPLTTHLFDSESEYLDSDVVFAVKESLIKVFALNERPEAATRFGVTAPFRELEHDFVLGL